MNYSILLLNINKKTLKMRLNVG